VFAAPWIFSRSGNKAFLVKILGLLLEHFAVANDGVEGCAQFV